MNCLIAWFLMMVMLIVILLVAGAGMIWEMVTGKDFADVTCQKLLKLVEWFEERLQDANTGPFLFSNPKFSPEWIFDKRSQKIHLL